MEKQFSYYQFQKDLNYPVYLRFENFEFENLFVEVIEELGFQKIERDSVKDLKTNDAKVLKIVRASQNVKAKMNFTQGGTRLSKDEVFHDLGLYDVYVYKNIAMMVLGEKNPLWELGVLETENILALRTILNRFLAQALAPLGIVGLWGIMIENASVIMASEETEGNAIFFDIKSKKVLAGQMSFDLGDDFSLLRLNPTMAEQGTIMTKENYYSFLSVKNIFLSSQFRPEKLTTAIFDLSIMTIGVLYPEHLLRPILGQDIRP